MKKFYYEVELEVLVFPVEDIVKMSDGQFTFGDDSEFGSNDSVDNWEW